MTHGYPRHGLGHHADTRHSTRAASVRRWRSHPTETQVLPRHCEGSCRHHIHRWPILKHGHFGHLLWLLLMLLLLMLHELLPLPLLQLPLLLLLFLLLC